MGGKINIFPEWIIIRFAFNLICELFKKIVKIRPSALLRLTRELVFIIQYNIIIPYMYLYTVQA